MYLDLQKCKEAGWVMWGGRREPAPGWTQNLDSSCTTWEGAHSPMTLSVYTRQKKISHSATRADSGHFNKNRKSVCSMNNLN